MGAMTTGAPDEGSKDVSTTSTATASVEERWRIRRWRRVDPPTEGLWPWGLLPVAGLAGVLLALPLIALGAYGMVVVGATLAVVRLAKTAENATDYSLMNTAKQLLWLPTSREEKYKAKQAVDSFFVRLGDLVAAFVVFAGTAWGTLGVAGFALVNLGCVLVWLVLALALVRRNRELGPAPGA